MVLKKITFKKKIQKAKTTSNFIIVEKPLLEIIDVKAGDIVEVTIEKINFENKKDKIISKALKIVADETGADYVKIDYKKSGDENEREKTKQKTK